MPLPNILEFIGSNITQRKFQVAQGKLLNFVGELDARIASTSEGYFKSYANLSEANADIANIPLNVSVRVLSQENGGDYYKASAGATTLTKSAYDPLTQAHTYTDNKVKSVLNDVYQKNKIVTYTSEEYGWTVGRRTHGKNGDIDTSLNGKTSELIELERFRGYLNLESIAAPYRTVFLYTKNQTYIGSLSGQEVSLNALPDNIGYVAFNFSGVSEVTPSSDNRYTIEQRYNELDAEQTIKWVTKDNTELSPGLLMRDRKYPEQLSSNGHHIKVTLKKGERIDFDKIILRGDTLNGNTSIFRLFKNGAVTTQGRGSGKVNLGYIEVADTILININNNIAADIEFYIPVIQNNTKHVISNMVRPADLEQFEITLPAYTNVPILVDGIKDQDSYYLGSGIIYNQQPYGTYPFPQSHELNAHLLTVPIPFNPSYPIEFVNAGASGRLFLDSEYRSVGYISNDGVILPSSIPKNARYVVATVNKENETIVKGFIGGELGAENITNLARKLGVPPLIPVAQGVQMALYKDNIRHNIQSWDHTLLVTEGAMPKNGAYPFSYKTTQTDRALLYSPNAVNETVKMTAYTQDMYGNPTSQVTNFSLKSVPNDNGNGRRKVCLICGDSQVDGLGDKNNPIFTTYLKDLFEQQNDMDMIFMGHRSFTQTIYGDTAEQNRSVTAHNASLGGTQMTYWYGSSSPFYNAETNQIDFDKYIADLANGGNASIGLQVGDKIDYFIFPMGVNDYNHNASNTEMIERYKTMQALVWAHSPDCKFIIGLTTQGTAAWSMQERRRWNIDYYSDLIDEFTKPEYDGKVYIAAAGVWTDNLYGSRQRRVLREPYNRLYDARQLLINKRMQESGLSREQAEDLVNNEYGYLVKERVLERFTEEFNTQDVVHSGYVAAMQQADCYYSMLRYLLEIDSN